MNNKYLTVISKKKNPGMSPFHGHVFSPASRAYFAWQEGRLDTGQLNQREAGKFFPKVQAGLTDLFAPTDIMNDLPPPDGKIASANQGNSEFLDEPGTHWQKHDVLSSDVLTVSWNYTAAHLTRRWNYFITRPNWNPNQPLSRAQFEEAPFHQVQLGEQPFWSHSSALTPPQPTVHDLILPERTGYHVLLAVWEVADTANAFYQVIDLNFVGEGATPEQPLPPQGVRVTNVTTSSVSLAWEAPVSRMAHYRVYRNDVFVAQTQERSLTNSGLPSNSSFEYAVSTVDQAGNESPRSPSVVARTLPENSHENPPTPPRNLHSMGETENSVSLMWGPSTTPNGLSGYLIYRDGVEIVNVQASQLTFLDTGLLPETAYRYFVAGQDHQGRLSVPSNVLSVQTLPTSGGGTIYPQWELNTFYPVGARVSFRGRNWMCLQAHTSHVESWSPGGEDSATLWTEIS